VTRSGEWTTEASLAFLESAPDAVVIIEPRGTIALANARTEELFGHTRADLVGQRVEVLLPDRFRTVHVGHRDGYLADPSPRPMGAGLELYGLRKGGTEFPVDISLSMIDTESGRWVAAAIRDMTDRRRAEEKFRSFLESAPDAVVIIEPDGRIALVNAQTEALFGYPRSALLGQPVEMLLPERYHDAHVGDRTGYLAEPRTRPMGAGLELYGRRWDGTEFPLDISLSPLDTEDGRLLAASIRDVTARKRLESARDEFIHHAAHELRTPLATLAALGETLAMRMDEMSEENVTRALGALQRQSARASRLVGDLLDLTRLEGGRAEVSLRPVEIPRLVGRVLESAPPPEGRQVHDATANLSVLADPLHLERVLTNLLSNAYRYGGPNITLESSGEDGYVTLTVADDGDGVSEDLLDNVFEPFIRGKQASAVGGSGVGLALCRSIVDTFGGLIWYESGEPGGARFRVRLREAE
jgi:PAS domain S-box-containing protein